MQTQPQHCCVVCVVQVLQSGGATALAMNAGGTGHGGDTNAYHALVPLVPNQPAWCILVDLRLTCRQGLRYLTEQQPRFPTRAHVTVKDRESVCMSCGALAGVRLTKLSTARTTVHEYPVGSGKWVCRVCMLRLQAAEQKAGRCA